MNTRQYKHGLALITLGLLAGCGEELIRATSTPAFADGYRDGCNQGSSSASNQKAEVPPDKKRLDSDPEYEKGWLAGNRNCNGSNVTLNPNTRLDPREIDGASAVYQ